MTEPLAPEAATLVDRYLDDLARMLADVPAGERADALGSVREYVDDALAQLGRPATARDVADVLRRLGRPEDLTHELLERGIVDADRKDAAQGTPWYGAPAQPVQQPGDGAATAALTLGVAALVVPMLGVLLGIGALVLAHRARRRGTRHDGRRVAAVALGWVGIAIGAVLLLGLAATVSMRDTVAFVPGP